MSSSEALIDDIYEAAAVPELWPIVLEQLSTVADADAATILSADHDGYGRYIATPAYETAYGDYVTNGRAYTNVRFGRSLERYPSAFSTDLELCSEAELEADPIYTEFVRPHGFAWTAGSAVPTPTGDLIVFDLARKLGADPFDRDAMARLDLLRPHLARAALLSHRLGLRSASNQTAACPAPCSAAPARCSR